MEISITAIGTALPSYKQSQMEIAHFIAEKVKLDAQKKRLLLTIYKASGIDHRYTVINDYQKTSDACTFFPNEPANTFPSTKTRMEWYQKNALPLAVQAIKNCIPNKNAYPSITHLITVSCTGMYAPGLDIDLIQHLSLPPTIQRTSINFMGCYASFHALKAAYSICKADPEARVLIVSVELCSLHLQDNYSRDHLISGALFSDGAGALLIESTDKHNTSSQHFSIQNFYSEVLPKSTEDMAWTISDQGFDIVLSSHISELIQKGIKPFMTHSLQHFNIEKEHIGQYAIHPGGVGILKACEKALDISAEDNEASYQVLRDYGNMSSASIIFVLQALWKKLCTKSSTKQQETIYSCAFGPGLTIESMLLKMHYV